MSKKVTNIVSVVLLVFIGSCAQSNAGDTKRPSCVSGKYENVNKLTLINPVSLSYKDEVIIIRLDELFYPVNTEAFIVTNSDKIIPAQLEDTDFDGNNDAIAFLIDIKPLSLKKIKISPSQTKPVFQQKAHAEISLNPSMLQTDSQGRSVDSGRFISQKYAKRHKDHVVNDGMYRFAGPLIESDKVGYRLYWAKHAAIDVYGKISEQFIGDFHKHNQNHHTMQSWGRDLLHNGPALGVGGLGAGKDINRVSIGTAQNAEIIIGSNGPIRASYRMIYKGIDYNGNRYDLTWDISMSAGKRYMEHNVTVIKGGKLDMLAALTNHTEQPDVAKIESIAQLGKLDYIATYGKQCYPDTNKELAAKSNEEMGMAVLWANNLLDEVKENDIEFEAVFKPAKKIKFYSLAAYSGEFENPINNMNEFNDYLETLSQRLANKLVIKQEN